MTTEHRPPRPSVRAWRWQLAACCLVLAALAFRQQPGLIVPDTKLDLTADPLGFLTRAMHLWEPAAAFGQLQNQAYGYLFPMGPFHLLGELAQLPSWIVQRAWWSVILVVAFLGMVRLATVLGVGRPWTRLLGGLLFALTPRILVSLGAVSIEAWPTALAPWVLVPLVRAYRGEPIVRNAAASALAIVCMGGVNAAATAAGVVPAALWLLLAPRWRGRLRFATWWVGCTLIATVWWWGPLLLLGAYSPPFLDWIETAANTTQHTSLVEAFRGSDHWLSYLNTAEQPQWPAGRLIAGEPLLVLDTVLVAAAGLAGLARTDMPARTVLLTGVVLGLVFVSTGYVGAAASPLAEQVRDLLDGPLAPLRNVHKFDVVLRVPLVLGVMHLLASLPGTAGRVRRIRVVAGGLAVVVLAGVATPALAGRLPQPGSYEAVPSYWRATAAWLDDNAGASRALLVPASPFAEYVWGATRDEPLQALTDAHWAVRDSVPLSSAGNIRLLDAIETRLAAGEGGPGVTTALRRAGVGLLVVRNDLDAARTGAPRAALVHQALDRMPGVDRVAAFGPQVGADDDPDVAVDSRLDVAYPAVEIFRLADPDAELRVRADPLEGTVRLSGGPESLLTAGDAGVLDGRAVFVAGDGRGVDDPAPLPVVTDGLRRRAVWFGAIRNNATHVLAATEDGPLDRAARDFLPVDDPDRETVAVVEGDVTDVTASSAGSDPLATMARGAQHSPWAAVDGDLTTSWMSGTYGEPEGEWLEVRFEEQRSIESIELVPVRGGPIGAPVTRIEVRTDAGAIETDVDPASTAVDLPVPDGATSTLRVRVLAVGDGTPTGVGVRELRIPEVSAHRVLRAAPLLEGDLGGEAGGPGAPATLVFAATDGARSSCVHTGDVARCAQHLGRAGEEHTGLRRRADLRTGGTYTITAEVTARPGPALESLIRPPPGALRAQASSRAVDDPRGRPQAAVDLDPGTGWVADPRDEDPTITLSWDEPRTVQGVQIAVQPWLAASPPRMVEIRAAGPAGSSVRAEVDDDGRARLPEPVETRELAIRVLAVDEVVNTDVDFGLRSPLPAGASEIRLLGPDELRAPIDESAPVPAECGDGPDIVVDGATVPTALHGTVGDLLRARPLQARPCSASGGVGRHLDLGPGEHDIALETSSATRPESLTLRPVAARAEPAADVPVRVQSWDPAVRRIAVADRAVDTVLTVTENANDGWQASWNGRLLEPVRVDGWAQGYLLPAGDGGVVELRYRPDAPYRAGLALGGLGAAAVLGSWWVARLRAGAPRQEPVRASPVPRPGRAGGRHGARRRTPIPAAAVLGTVALVLLGGFVGAAAAGVGAAVRVAGSRWRRVRLMVPAMAATAALAGGAVVAAHPWPGPNPGAHSGLAQGCVLLALSVCVIGSSAHSRAGPPASRRPHATNRAGYRGDVRTSERPSRPEELTWRIESTGREWPSSSRTKASSRSS